MVTENLQKSPSIDSVDLLESNEIENEEKPIHPLVPNDVEGHPKPQPDHDGHLAQQLSKGRWLVALGLLAITVFGTTTSMTLFTSGADEGAPTMNWLDDDSSGPADPPTLEEKMSLTHIEAPRIRTALKGENSGTESSSSEKQLPFPIIDQTDDVVPSGYASTTLKAADALECRDSVVNYVINATDAKDECDGLKKAFDKTCNSDPPQKSVEKEHGARHLFETDKSPHSWKFSIYRASRQLRLTVLRLSTFFFESDFFFPEEEVMRDAWVDAKFQVENDFDIELRRRHLERVAEQVKDEAKNEHVTETQQTKEPPKDTPHKPVSSLTLPTSNQHISNQMLSETLLLQNNEDNIKNAIMTVANQTNATLNSAAVDAALSAKAVQDTTAVVSAVLNDPTSVEARTCCASILNVFHENCDTPDKEEVSDKKLFLIVFVIAFCGMVKSIIRHYQLRWLPEAAGCILVGVLCGAIMSFVPHYDISFDGNWFLRIMVPPIVFEAALSIDKRSFNKHIVPIITFAVVGTLMATVITAMVIQIGTSALRGICDPFPYVESLTFGALISSIDPIAVLSVLSNMGMTDTDTIYVLIFGESLLNDGVAIVLFETLVHFLDESLVIDTGAIIGATIHFFVVAIGSLIVGVGSGIVCTAYYSVMHGCQTPLVEVLLFFCWAFIPYYVCDGIGWSGIVAVVATGFVMDLYVVGQNQGGPEEATVGEGTGKSTQRNSWFSKKGHLSAVAKTHVGFVTEILATMMETAIFAYLGVFLFSSRYHWNFWYSFLAIFACCFSRAIMIPCMSAFANWITTSQQLRENCRKSSSPRWQSTASQGVVIDKKMQIVLWIAGLRGAMSFALVENIPLYDTVTGEGSRWKAELKAMTSATIMFTVFVLGGYTFYMMENLGMAPKKSGSSSEMVSLVGRTSEISGSGEHPFDASCDVDDIVPERTMRQRQKS